jgi:hypothetical protein
MRGTPANTTAPKTPANLACRGDAYYGCWQLPLACQGAVAGRIEGVYVPGGAGEQVAGAIGGDRDGDDGELKRRGR